MVCCGSSSKMSKRPVLLLALSVVILLTNLTKAGDLDYRLLYGLGSYCKVKHTFPILRTCSFKFNAGGFGSCLGSEEEYFDLSGKQWRDCNGGTVYTGEGPLGTRALPEPRFTDWDWDCLITVSGRWPISQTISSPVGPPRLQSNGMLSIFISKTYAMPPIKQDASINAQWVIPNGFLFGALENFFKGEYHDLYTDPLGIANQTPGDVWNNPVYVPELPEAVTIPIPWFVTSLRFPTVNDTIRYRYSGGFDPSDGLRDSPLSLAIPSANCKKLLFGYKKIPAGFPSQTFEIDRESDMTYSSGGPSPTQNRLSGIGAFSPATARPFAFPSTNPYDYRVWLDGTEPSLFTLGNAFGAFLDGYCFKVDDFCEFQCPPIQALSFPNFGVGPLPTVSTPLITTQAFYAAQAWAYRSYRSYADCAATFRSYDQSFVTQGLFENLSFEDFCIYEDNGGDSGFVGTVTWLRNSGVSDCTDPYVNIMVPGALNTDTPGPVYAEWRDEYTWGIPRTGRVLTVLGLGQSALNPRPSTSQSLYDINRLQFVDGWCRVTAPTMVDPTADPVGFQAYLNASNNRIQPGNMQRGWSVHNYLVDGIPVSGVDIYADVNIAGLGTVLAGNELTLGNGEVLQLPAYSISGLQPDEAGVVQLRRLNPLNPYVDQYTVWDRMMSAPPCRCVNSTSQVVEPGDMVCNLVAGLYRRPVTELTRPSVTLGAAMAQRNCSVFFASTTPASFQNVDGRFVVNQYQTYILNSTYVDLANPRFINERSITYRWFVSSTDPYTIDPNFDATAQLYNLTAYAPGTFNVSLDVRSAVSLSVTRCTIQIEVIRACPPMSINVARTELALGEVIQMEASSPSVYSSLQNSQLVSWGLMWTTPLNASLSAAFTNPDQRVVRFSATEPGLYSVIATIAQVSDLNKEYPCLSSATVLLSVANASTTLRRRPISSVLNLTTSCLGDGGFFDADLPNTTRYQTNVTNPPTGFVPLGKSNYDTQTVFSFQRFIAEVSSTFGVGESGSSRSFYTTMTDVIASVWRDQDEEEDSQRVRQNGKKSGGGAAGNIQLTMDPPSNVAIYIIVGIGGGLVALVLFLQFWLYPIVQVVSSCCDRCKKSAATAAQDRDSDNDDQEPVDEEENTRGSSESSNQVTNRKERRKAGI